MKAVDSDVDIVVSGVECGGTVALLTWPRVVRGWHRDLNSSSVWSVRTRTRRKRGTDTADAGLQMALLILSAVPAISDTTQIYTILLSPSFLNN